MRHLLVVVVLTFTTSECLEGVFDRSLDHTWGLFQKTYSKKYSLEEEKFRRTIWEDNVRLIRSHNLEYDLGLHSYTLGINEYADLTSEEYKRYLLGYRLGNISADWQAKPYRPKGGKLPSTVDWRKHGYVTPVKNQGACGSCWAFSSTGSLEGQHYKVTGTLYSLSEQNLVDCTRNLGNAGCNGGWMDTAFKYVKLNKGIDIDYGYPYQAKDGPCRFKRDYVAATDNGAFDIQSRNETALQSAVAHEGPISVAIDATHKSFMLYKSGVYDEPKCTHRLDHAVLVVGYGSTEDGSDYWLVKNSWGKSWGMKGYIMMSRNKDNQCGIADKASFPKV